jgi:hypothetical protein
MLLSTRLTSSWPPEQQVARVVAELAPVVAPDAIGGAAVGRSSTALSTRRANVNTPRRVERRQHDEGEHAERFAEVGRLADEAERHQGADQREDEDVRACSR